MKPLMVIYMSALFVLVFSPCASIAEENTSEEYVYALKVKGGIYYKSSQQADDAKKETDKRQVRRMEIIYPGTVLEIEKGASISLTRCGSKIINPGNKDEDSSYTVNLSDFKRDGSISGRLLQRFLASLINFVHPGSNPGQKVHIKVRTGNECKNNLPSDYAKIMVTEEPVTFLLQQEGSNFSLKIKEFDSGEIIYSKEATTNRIDVPIETFTPGKAYEWFTKNIKTGVICNASFTLLSKDDSIKIIKALNELTSLLPEEADAETRFRFQAGYLISEGLEYDAWRLLDRNGVF